MPILNVNTIKAMYINLVVYSFISIGQAIYLSFQCNYKDLAFEQFNDQSVEKINADENKTLQIIYLLLCALFMLIYTLYFYFHSIKNSNIYEFITFLVISTISTILMILKMIQQIYLWPTLLNSIINAQMIIIVLINQIIFFFFRSQIQEDLNWRSYKISPQADVQSKFRILDSYFSYLMIKTVLKVQNFCTIAFLFTYCFIIVDFQTILVQNIIECFMCIFYLIINIFTIISLLKESKNILICQFVTSILMNLYSLIRIILVIYKNPDQIINHFYGYTFIFLLFACILFNLELLSIVLIGFNAFASKQYSKHFGHGLRQNLIQKISSPSVISSSSGFD